jgi:hypothetical protein
MNSKISTIVTTAVVLAIPPPAAATLRQETGAFTPAGICQLSLPTTNTGARPRATGYRNEGSTNIFVICSPFVPNYAGLRSVSLYFLSLDGAPHSVTCTAASGYVGISGGIVYSAQTMVADSTTSAKGLAWDAADFGASEYIPGAGHFSVTCSLPSQASIGNGYMYYDFDVGQ